MDNVMPAAYLWGVHCAKEGNYGEARNAFLAAARWLSLNVSPEQQDAVTPDRLTYRALAELCEAKQMNLEGIRV